MLRGRCIGAIGAPLAQIQFGCPVNSHAQLAVEALGIGISGAGGDYEFLCDLWRGKLGLKRAESFKRTLSEWLNQRF
jgi:hypothetical protein